MKKNVIEMGAVMYGILLLALSSIFAGFCLLPMCVVTRPIVRWAFCVRRALEQMCKRHLAHHGYLVTSNGKIY